MELTSSLKRRLLVAVGAATFGAGCPPKASPEVTPNQEQAPLPSSSASTPSASTAAEPTVSATALASAATSAAEIASAAPSTSASVAASASSAAPGKTIPFPAEPHCFGGPCAEQQVCTKASPTPLPFGLPPPFQGCASRVGRGTFSKIRSETQRKVAPDVCCYVELRRPIRGRALYVAQQIREAALRPGVAAWS